MLLTTPSENAPLYRMGLLRSFDTKVGHLRRYNKVELTKLINDKGFKIQVFEIKEGILRNFLFTFKIGNFPLRVINKLKILGDVFTVADNILLKLFGGSNYYILAKKK